ncbi:hypothetical protein EIP91_006655 [Steccherinum ochraceum]|uniref:BTB domain-containing protein n=1 Tax=Steccherinum ochraceum TaxID=92696 RepID=A0A4R0R5B1_9APHY|nr:hypothetical protein EIP91_006655 [Steccherinum ochraceum]
MANPLFDDINLQGADTVLQSSDYMLFYVHRVLLSLASPVFAALFDIGTPNHPHDQPTVSGLPIIPVEEKCDVLKTLLHWVYPVLKPPLLEIGHTADVLQAAIKYEIQAVVGPMTARLRTGADDSPARVYGLACRLGLEGLARDAARIYRANKKRRTGSNYRSDMASIPAGAYVRLSWYTANGAGSPPDSFKFVYRSVADGIVPSESSAEAGVDEILPSDAWVQDTVRIFMNNPSDLVICSSEADAFAAHKLVVSIMSPTLAKLIETQTDGILDLPESSFVIHKLLRCSYGLPLFTDADSQRPCFSFLIRVVDAARNYEMAHVEQQARAFLRNLIQTKPLRSYCTAIALGWRDDAVVAARAVLAAKINVLQTYVHELELIPAIALHNLVTYLNDVAWKVEKVTQRYAKYRTLRYDRYPDSVKAGQSVVRQPKASEHFGVAVLQREVARLGLGKSIEVGNLASEIQEMEEALRWATLEVALPAYKA